MEYVRIVQISATVDTNKGTYTFSGASLSELREWVEALPDQIRESVDVPLVSGAE